MRTRDAGVDFHLLENSHKLRRSFQQAMKTMARKTCFISGVTAEYPATILPLLFLT